MAEGEVGDAAQGEKEADVERISEHLGELGGLGFG